MGVHTQLLVSTKWLRTPSDVLMLNVLLEWACNPFCREGIFAIGMIKEKTPTHFVEKVC